MQKNVLKSSYFRNILTLSGGTIFAQFILLISQPFITRIYGQVQIGYYEILNSIYAVLSTVICLRYDITIVSAENEREAQDIFLVGAIIAACLSVVVTILLVIAVRLNIGSLTSVGYKALLVPIWSMVVGFNSLLTSYNNRKKQYRLIVSVILLRAVIMGVGQLLLGLMWPNFIVLVLICIIAECSGMIRQYRYAFGEKNIGNKINIKRLIAIAVKYKKQPLFSTPAVILNTLAFSSIVLFIGYYYKDIAYVAYYALAYRIVGLPATFIGTSIGRVFYSKACDEWNESKNFTKTLTSTVVGLAIVSTIGFGVLTLIPNIVYSKIFGDGWEFVGVVLKIMIPFSIVRTIASPVSLSVTVAQKQQLEILMQFGLMMLIGICSILAYTMNITFINYLKLNNIALTLVYTVWIIMFFKVSREKSIKESVNKVHKIG